MKIAIMSDIHGNHIALEAVLDDIKNQKVDKIFVLGDIITDFPQKTKEVLDKIRSLDAYVIRGNREEYILAQARGEYGNALKRFDHYSSLLSTWEQLDSKDIKYLKSLPLQMSVMYSKDFNLKLVHGSPFSQTQGLGLFNQQVLEQSTNAISENILLSGHSHVPMKTMVNNKIVINVGSVGLNFDGKSHAHYTLITYENSNIKIDMKEIPYNLEKFKKSCNLEDTWVYLSYKSLEDGENYVNQVLKQASEATNQWPIPNEIWNNLFEQVYIKTSN